MPDHPDCITAKRPENFRGVLFSLLFQEEFYLHPYLLVVVVVVGAAAVAQAFDPEAVFVAGVAAPYFHLAFAPSFAEVAG